MTFFFWPRFGRLDGFLTVDVDERLLRNRDYLVIPSSIVSISCLRTFASRYTYFNLQLDVIA